MTKTTWLLAVSIGCNALLMTRSWETDPPAASAPAGIGAWSEPDSAEPVVRAPGGELGSDSAAVPSSFRWEALESDDYPTYIANLRGIRCPAETIRDLVVADIRHLFATKRRELERSATSNLGQRLSLLAASRREEEAVLDALLGPDWRCEKDDLVDAPTRPGSSAFSSPATEASVRDIEDRFERETTEWLARTGGLELEADRSELRDLEARKYEALAAVLTPAEYIEYLRGHHPVANDMQREGFSYRDEREFLAVLAERERREDDSHSSAEEAETRIQSLLGPERYLTYRRSQRAEYRELVALVRRFGLDDAVSGQVQDVIDRHSGPDVGGGPADPAMRRDEIRRLLGPQAFRAWEETGLALALSPD